MDPDDAFSSIPYEKGARLVVSLERAVGEAAFDGFIQAYMKHFRFQQYSGDTTGMPVFSMSPAQTLLSNAMLRDLLDHDYYMLTDLIKGKSAASGGATDLSDLFAVNGEDIRIFTWGGTKVKFSDTAVLNGVSAFEQNFVAELIDLDFDVLIGSGKKHVWVPDARTSKQALS